MTVDDSRRSTSTALKRRDAHSDQSAVDSHDEEEMVYVTSTVLTGRLISHLFGRLPTRALRSNGRSPLLRDSRADRGWHLSQLLRL